ncbi:unannotated protein [freshwater metagenome]|uniref:Unannotated protein n=1 Tax=freshwater metagenome TaxID=449393 RepID=A0A6J7C3E5_9ZZZZ|nr:VOC family protein [Actinomycetota bacterium]MSW37739.1 VOC family protein [Actinomycetota bacterium]MSX39249.1 VOC family protein [Actinomycetota bacterium]
MATRFDHTTIVTDDPERLALFYIDIFDCVRSGPPRDLSGDALEKGMGLPGAHVQGVHLRLPGHGEQGPVLEIFKLPEITDGSSAITARGLMHLAFSVDDIRATLERLLAAGGSMLGEIAEVTVPGVGTAEFLYTRDPVGTIVELQGWK